MRKKEAGCSKAYSVFDVAQIDGVPASAIGLVDETLTKRATLSTPSSPRPKLISALVETAPATFRRWILFVCPREATARAVTGVGRFHEPGHSPAPPVGGSRLTQV